MEEFHNKVWIFLKFMTKTTMPLENLMICIEFSQAQK